MTVNIKNVMVPTDFSEPSKMALNYGVAVARTFGARLTLLHVIEPQPVLGVAVTKADIEALDLQQREQALQKLSSLVAPEDEDDLDLHVVLKVGNAREEIAAAVREHRADTVVVGTHGRGRLGRFLLGSTTNALLRNLPVPVMTVCHSAATRAFKRILFATDLSDASRVGFAYALDVAKTLGADVTAVHVLGGNTAQGELGIGLQTPEDGVETECRKLGEFAAEGERRGIKVRTLLASGPAATQIVKTAEESEADLIVLTTEKKGVVKRVLLGTTAEHVIRETSIPVLSVPVEMQAGAAQSSDNKSDAPRESKKG